MLVVVFLEAGEEAPLVRVVSLLSGIRTMFCILVPRAFNLFCLPSMLTVFRRRRLTLLFKRFLCPKSLIESLLTESVTARVRFLLQSALCFVGKALTDYRWNFTRNSGMCLGGTWLK